jgi:hypothetical protein
VSHASPSRVFAASPKEKAVGHRVILDKQSLPFAAYQQVKRGMAPSRAGQIGAVSPETKRGRASSFQDHLHEVCKYEYIQV